MIEKMQFLNITGPKDDIDRVIETYISKYDIQLENTLYELKNVKELHPFTDVNPYKDIFARSQELKEYFKDTTITTNRRMNITEADDITKLLSDKVNSLSEEKAGLEAELSQYEDKLKSVHYFIGIDCDTEKILHSVDGRASCRERV